MFGCKGINSHQIQDIFSDMKRFLSVTARNSKFSDLIWTGLLICCGVCAAKRESNSKESLRQPINVVAFHDLKRLLGMVRLQCQHHISQPLLMARGSREPNILGNALRKWMGGGESGISYIAWFRPTRVSVNSSHQDGVRRLPFQSLCL